MIYLLTSPAFGLKPVLSSTLVESKLLVADAIPNGGYIDNWSITLLPSNAWTIKLPVPPTF